MSPALPAAVLFDRDGTLVHNVPYNADPALVQPVPGARAQLHRLRGLGIALAVVSNQSGVARGLITNAQLAAVNAEVERLLGPFGAWAVCPHGERDGCGCRKPRPGLVLRAAAALGVPVSGCVLIGDSDRDVHAALAAGARAVRIAPGPRHRMDRAVPVVADSGVPVVADLSAAVAAALGLPLPTTR